MRSKKMTLFMAILMAAFMAGSVHVRAQVVPPPADTDGDGIPDTEDDCPATDPASLTGTVVIDGVDTGVANTLFPNGCSFADLILECAEAATNHGRFVRCVAHLANGLKKQGVISGRQKGKIQSAAAHADIP
jgi:hypothetical protein